MFGCVFRCSSIFFAACLLFLHNSFAQNRFGKFAADLNDIQLYLNDITTMEADFVQTDSDKRGRSSGKFYLKRPDKICIDYILGSIKAKVVFSDGLVTYLDKELEEVAYMRANKTALSILLSPNVSFKEANISDVFKNRGIIGVTFYVRDGDSKNYVTINFKMKPDITVHSINTMNPDQDISTKMVFSKIVFGKDIDKAHFVIKDPKIIGK